MNNFNDIDTILQSNQNNINAEKTLLDTFGILLKDLEISQNHNRSLEEQLTINDYDEKTKTTLYIKLKEENSKLEEQNERLHNELNQKLEEFEVEKKHLQTEYEMKLDQLEKELEESKNKLKLKEKEFFDELQMAQITTAYEFNKVEQQLKLKLSETNKKLEESNFINSKLKIQLQKLESQKETLSERHEISNQSFSISNHSIMEETPSGIMESGRKPIPMSIRQCEPIQSKCVTSFQDKEVIIPKTPEKPKNKSKLFRGKNKKLVPIEIPKNSTVQTYPESVLKKKRKLYDPEDFYSLHQFSDND